MDDAYDGALDELLAKAVETPADAVRASYVMADLQKLAPIYYDEDTRPVAEAAIAQWQEDGNELRKAISAAWLNRAATVIGRKAATSAVGKAAVQGGRAIAGAAAHVTGKVEQAGANAGQAIASRVAVGGAYQAGHDAARNAGLANGARVGRAMARHAFHAGLTAAGAGGIAAGAGLASRQMRGGAPLSQAQHDERVNAGKHRPQGAAMAMGKRFKDPAKMRTLRGAMSRMMAVSKHRWDTSGEAMKTQVGLRGRPHPGGPPRKNVPVMD